MTLATIEHVTFKVPAISCGHCVRKSQDAIRDLPGVIEAHANAETRFMDVDFDPDLVTSEHLVSALAKAGFPVQY